jgi:hypothetical protein
VRPKVIQTHFVDFKMLFVISSIARLYRVNKVIAFVHSMKNIKRKSKRRFAYNNYNHVSTVSEAIAKNLVYGGVNSKIIATHYAGLFNRSTYSGKSKSELKYE